MCVCLEAPGESIGLGLTPLTWSAVRAVACVCGLGRGSRLPEGPQWCGIGRRVPPFIGPRVFQLRGGIRAFIIIEQPRNECSPVESSTHLCREGRGPPLVQACVCSITERGSSFRGAYTLVGSINKNFFFLQLGCDTCLKGGGVGASRARGGGRASSGWPSVPHIRVPGMS